MQDYRANFSSALTIPFNLSKTVLAYLVSFLVIVLQTKIALASQKMEATLKLSTDSMISIEIRSEKEDAFWEFLTSYAEVSNLEKRIENLRFFDENGVTVTHERIGKGKYVTDKPVRHLQYEVKVLPADDFAGIAHVSWINQSHGLLILSDLIPRNFETTSAKVIFNFPLEWKILSNAKEINENSSSKRLFVVEKVGKAVFLLCQDFQEKNFFVGKTSVKFALVGDWEFSEQASELARKIFLEYTSKLGQLAFPKVYIFLLPFPEKTRFNYWQAETKDATITIVSAPATFKSNALNLLSEQLRHEILHLWIPNSLALKGNYDWFFEGFVIYQSLKTGVFMGEIRFKDFLSHIAAAFDSIQNQDSFGISLIEISRNRWQLSSTEAKRKSFYAKSLLVAFLFDLSLLKNRRKGIETILYELLSEFSNKAEDANKAVLKILRKYDANLVSRYIEGNMQINLQNYLADLGIQIKRDSGRTKLEVAENLSSRQKDLLKKLGYNQWRRASAKVKP